MTTALRVVADDDLHFDGMEDYHALRTWAEMFNDLQKTRIGIGNRLGRKEGMGMLFREHFANLEKTEHDWQLALVRQYRKTVPPGVIAWQKTQNGIGAPLLARLLGHLGHPRLAVPQHWEGTGSNRKLVEDPPYERTKAQLRQYCGHGDPKRVKFKGMTAEDAFRLGNPKCKMLVYLLSKACMLQPGTPVSVLLGSDQIGCGPQQFIVGAEDLSVTNGQVIADPQSSSGVGGIPLLDPDHVTVELHTSRVGVEDLSVTNGQAKRDEPQGRAVVGGTSKAPKRRLSPVNGDHHESESYDGPVAVDGTSSPSSDRAPSDSQARDVAAGGTPRYRLVYEQRRLATVDRTHDGPCVRCGPSGHPAGDGSPWSAQHQQADALRIVGKAILNDLWDAAEL